MNSDLTLLQEINKQYPNITDVNQVNITPQTRMMDGHTSVFVWQDNLSFTFTIEGYDRAFRFYVTNVHKPRGSIIAGLFIIHFLLDLGYDDVAIYTNTVGSGSLRYQLGSGFKGSFQKRRDKNWKTTGGKLLKDADLLGEASDLMNNFTFITIENTSKYGDYPSRKLQIFS